APGTQTLGVDRIQRAFADRRLLVRAPSRNRPAATRDLQAGEVEALWLAEDMNADLLLTDDGAARSAAAGRGMTPMGTVGVLRAARGRGAVPAVLPLVLEVQRLGQWLSDELIDRVRQEEESLA